MVNKLSKLYGNILSLTENISTKVTLTNTVEFAEQESFFRTVCIAQCQCQYEDYSAAITKRTWVHYIVHGIQS